MANHQVAAATPNLKVYFHQRLPDAVAAQKLSVDDDAMVYLINLLDSFARTDVLFDYTADGPQQAALASYLEQALSTNDARRRSLLFRRLGDVALFVAGWFADSLSRSQVDVDYYVAMGGRAYSHLSDQSGVGRVCPTALVAVFAQLASQFERVVEAIAIVAESESEQRDTDVLSDYRHYLRTGCERTARRLARCGIQVQQHNSALKQ